MNSPWVGGEKKSDKVLTRFEKIMESVHARIEEEKEKEKEKEEGKKSLSFAEKLIILLNENRKVWWRGKEVGGD